jgi:hypothetical protein
VKKNAILYGFEKKVRGGCTNNKCRYIGKKLIVRRVENNKIIGEKD